MRYLRTLHIVWSLVRRGVTRRLTRLQTMYNVIKFSEKWWNNVKQFFTGTATQPQCNRKCCQFNKDQYCKFANIFNAIYARTQPCQEISKYVYISVIVNFWDNTLVTPNLHMTFWMNVANSWWEAMWLSVSSGSTLFALILFTLHVSILCTFWSL